jgi:heptosyltransferase-2
LPEKVKSFFNSHPKPWVALAPGGARNLLREDALRRWPLDRYARLAELLQAEGFQVVLTGAAGDGWVREAFQGSGCLDLIGQTSLGDLVALYARCRLVVTHDSGPLHLAALSGARVLALFGPTNPAEKMPPEGSARALWGGEKLACRPCYDGKNYAPCRRNVCLEGVGVEVVFKNAMEMIREKR